MLPRPLLIVVTGPSGTGKSTLCKRLLAELPEVRYSVSCTTRPPRGAEKDGEAYHFLSRDEFVRRVEAGEFIEHAEVYGNLYGTLKSEVAHVLEAGGSVLMDIDVEGAAQVRGIVRTLPQGDLMRDGFTDIFVEPPSMDDLKQRLEKRAEDTPEIIARRLEHAAREIARAGEFTHRIVNCDLDAAYAEFKRILKMRFPNRKAVFLDLDGTVYSGAAAIPGAAEFVRDCTARGIRCVFVTNRANRTPEEVRDQLVSMGIPCVTDDILTTAAATANYIVSAGPDASDTGHKPSAFIIGEHGLARAFAEHGIRITNETDEKPEFVVTSLDRSFTYDKMCRAVRHIVAGAKFIATNPDAFLTVEDGIMPGAGSIAAAVATASAGKPVIIGKPERHLIDLALALCGVTKEEALVVGDNIDTDIMAGINAGVETALMLTGVSTRDDVARTGIKPDAIAAGFNELGEMLF